MKQFNNSKSLYDNLIENNTSELSTKLAFILEKYEGYCNIKHDFTGNVNITCDPVNEEDEFYYMLSIHHKEKDCTSVKWLANLLSMEDAMNLTNELNELIKK